MAYVAISSALREAIKDNIMNMAALEKKPFPEPSNIKHVSADDPMSLMAAWGSRYDQRNTFDEDWTAEVNSIELHAMHTREDSTTVSTRFSLKAQTPAGDAAKFRVPNLRSIGYWSLVVAVPETHHLIAPRMEWAIQMDDIDRKWKDIREQVIKFLDSVKSLNEAVKLWPAVGMYIPVQYKERLEKKVEKKVESSEAADILAGMDTDLITAAAVAARFNQI